MEFKDLRELIKRQPFCPLQFHLTDGATFEIRHPDMAMLGRTAITLGIPSPAEGEHWAVVPLSSILWVEVIIGMS